MPPKPLSGPYLHFGDARPVWAVMDIAAAHHNIDHPDDPKKDVFTFADKAGAVKLRALMDKKGVPSKLMMKHIPAWTILESNEVGHEFPPLEEK